MNSQLQFDPARDDFLYSDGSWRELDSKFLSNDGSNPHAEKRLHPLSPTDRLDHILSHPSLYVRASDLILLMENVPASQLKPHFQVIVEAIFGFTTDYPSWSLRCITEGLSSKEFAIILNLLGPTGPLLSLATKLLEDPSFLLETGLDQLPSMLIRRIHQEREIPPYFSNRVVSLMNSMTGFRLNSFEFFMFSFASHICAVGGNGGAGGGPRSQDYLRGWGMTEDNVYHHLLKIYLAFFFPTDGRGVSGENFRMTFQRVNEHPSTWRPFDAKERPKLIKSCFLMENQTMSQRQEAFFRKSQVKKEVWRSETILTIWTELWISHVEKTSSPIEQIMLPAVDVVKTVRMVVRHLHFFVNCVTASVMHPMQDMKREVIPTYERKLYRFLRHLFINWPLDSSFQIIYETWLSFVQPWRYYIHRNFFAGNHQKEAEVLPVVVDLSRWYPFIQENILFYTKLFGIMLTRMSRVEFATSKNALMFYRVAKVFTGHEGLKVVLRNFDEFIFGSPSANLRVKQVMMTWEYPHFVYESFFSGANKEIVGALLQAAKTAINQLQELIDATLAQQTRNQSWFDTLFGLNKEANAVVGQSIAELKKAKSHLEYGRNQFASFFEISIENAPNFSTEQAMSSSPSTSLTGQSLFASSLDGSALEGTENRVKVIPACLFSCDVLVPIGNPDIAPVGTDEVAVLVCLMKTLSDSLNDIFTESIINVYFQRNWKGRVARALFAKPVEYFDVGKRMRAKSGVKVRKTLPPRVSLRFLCSRNVVCALGLLFAFFLFNDFTPLSSFGMMLVVWAFVVFVNAVSEPDGKLDDLASLFHGLK